MNVPIRCTFTETDKSVLHSRTFVALERGKFWPFTSNIWDILFGTIVQRS